MALFKRKQKEEQEIKDDETVEKQEALPARAGELSAPSLPKGGDVRSYQVVLSPHITEKGTLMGGDNKYSFKIAADANKTEVKRAIEGLYKVKVDRVNVSYLPSKSKRIGRFKGFKLGFKKAIVTLKEGSKIDIAS